MRVSLTKHEGDRLKQAESISSDDSQMSNDKRPRGSSVFGSTFTGPNALNIEARWRSNQPPTSKQVVWMTKVAPAEPLYQGNR